ncbi:putative reverse transcriptase domain-containing protein [Tanacetum coccineum]
MVGLDIHWYTARFHELARLVPHMVTPENQRVNRYIWGLAPEIKANVTSSRHTTIQSVVSMANCLTTDGIKDKIFKKENAGNKNRLNDQFKNQGMNDKNKRQRIRRNFATTAPDQGQAQRGIVQGLEIDGNPNQGNNRNQACGRAFALGVAEAPQDPNIVTGTFSMNDHFDTILSFSLNDHFATALFDSGADYSFIFTNFLPLIDMKTSVLNPCYEIEIANDLKVETNKIVQGCRLELEGHTFIIDLIPFGHGSFDVIVGMDWLSKRKAKIVCLEKIV